MSALAIKNQSQAYAEGKRGFENVRQHLDPFGSEGVGSIAKVAEFGRRAVGEGQERGEFFGIKSEDEALGEAVAVAFDYLVEVLGRKIEKKGNIEVEHDSQVATAIGVVFKR